MPIVVPAMRKTSPARNVNVRPTGSRSSPRKTSNGAPKTTQPRSQPACSVGPARQISRAAASGGLPTRALPSVSDQRSAAPPTGTPRLRAARPAEIDHQGLQARLENAEAHANGAMVKPAAVSAARSARTNSSACGLSPWTQSVRTPRSLASQSGLLRGFVGIVDEGVRLRTAAPGEPSGR